MSNPKNEEYAITERRQRVASLYLSGATQCDIARTLRVSQPTVCLDLKAIRQGWLESATRDFDQAKAEELAKLAHLRAEAMAGWERSCRPLKPGGPVRAGEARFLAEATRCVVAECKVLGLIRGDKTIVQNVVGLPWDDLLKGLSEPVPDPLEREVARLEDRRHYHDNGDANGHANGAGGVGDGK